MKSRWRPHRDDSSAIYIFSVDNSGVIALRGHAMPARKLTWANANTLVSLDTDETVTIWDLKRAGTFSKLASEVRSLALDPGNGPWALEPGSARTLAVNQLLTRLKAALSNSGPVLPPCPPADYRLH